MTRAVPLSRFMPYGAPDLLAAGPAYLSRAVLASSALAIAVFALAVLVMPRNPGAHPRPIAVAPRVFTLDPHRPPTPRIESVPPLLRTMPPSRSKEGVVQAVPDAPEITEPVAPQPTGPSEGDRTVESGPAPPGAPGIEGEEAYPSPGEFVYVDELPVAIREVKPEYPSFAREAGVEGLVVVLALVGKDGRIVEARVQPKRSVPLLDGAALEAARRWVFLPAHVNRRPVAVWVTLSFRFRLNE